MADAAYVILNRPAKTCTGNFFIDQEVLQSAGVSDFSSYAVDLSAELYTDLFIRDPSHPLLNPPRWSSVLKQSRRVRVISIKPVGSEVTKPRSNLRKIMRRLRPFLGHRRP
ncbi:MAG: hypothetical protein ACREX4_10355 [Gammaproteobacteria bacterium]